MRFKIHGEKEKLEDNPSAVVVEILGKNAVMKLIDERFYHIAQDLEKQIYNLNKRLDKLEEEVAIKRRELLKLGGKND